MPEPPRLLTEKLLVEAGGWQVFRQARSLHEAGRVLRAQWQPPLLQGQVREGEREYRAGLKIESRSRIDNLCTCRVSRGSGMVCAHSIAVGLAALAPISALSVAQPGVAEADRSAGESAGARLPEIPFVADPAAKALLHVIVSPDLAAAWERGQFVLGLEIAAAPGAPPRLLHTVVDLKRKYSVTNIDYTALQTITVLLGGDLPRGGPLVLDRDQFLSVLEGLRGHPRVTLGRGALVAIAAAPLRPILRAAPHGDSGSGVRLAVEWPSPCKVLLAGASAPPWLLGRDGRELTPLTPGLPAAYRTLYQEAKILSPAEAAAFLSREWPSLEPYFDLRLDVSASFAVSARPPGRPEREEEGAMPEFTLDIEGSLNELTARLQAVYKNDAGGRATAGLQAGAASVPGPSSGRRFTRALAAEEAALARLTASGFTGPNPDGRLVLRGQEGVLRFFAGELPALQRDWEVKIGARFQHVSRQIDTIVPEIQVRGSGEDWFELDISLVTRGGRGEAFSASEIQRLLQMGKSSTRLRDGRLAALPVDSLDELQTVLRDCEPDQRRPGLYRIKKIHAGYLDEALERFGPAPAGGPGSWEAWKQAQRSFSKPEAVPLPDGLKSILRPYQKEGVYWLRFLAQNGLAGILADEMGLGKTLQALAFFAISKARAAAPASGTGAHRTNEDRAREAPLQPALLICPTSLVQNWQREAARFTPELRLLAIEGPARAPLFGRIDDSDLVITSYGLLRRDVERYRAREFSTVILDEAHHIKNPESQSARAACALRARHRFVLTGTPMENSVRDLWSILHFLLPGYLGSRQDFRDRYELPIGRGGAEGAAVQQRLGRRLRPVLLRRRKNEVLHDLPEKIEQVAYCDLTPSQADTYRQLLELSRRKLDDARRDKNQARGRMLVLTALLRLRQTCCDLRLLGPPSTEVAGKRDEADIADEPAANPSEAQVRDLGATAENQPAASSGKLGLLDELLEQIREGGHRVLIFSQFVSMLKLLSDHLHSAAIPFAYLDGHTKDRQTVVDRFQADPSLTAFLISIKAGGVGLNLTAADTVIIFDPWWNPAVEAQATDRAHRIGQKNVVTAYKLIARGTVEEKILDLQRKKRELTGALVEGEEDEPLLTNLSLAEIESLLE